LNNLSETGGRAHKVNGLIRFWQGRRRGTIHIAAKKNTPAVHGLLAPNVRENRQSVSGEKYMCALEEKETIEFESAAPFIPPRPTLPKLQAAAAHCMGCDLYRRATQTVFGEGPPSASVMLVGEQPGDVEDRVGRPFVGPAGRILDRALEDAGIDRDKVFVTNAVKHFKWEERGKRRLHSKPSARQVQACRPWLEAEIKVVQPHIIVAMGATASYALLGPAFRLTQHRGELNHVPAWPVPVIATVHPSSILRAPDERARRANYALFVTDMKQIKRALEKL
jgi:DNA polymerase